jgi:lysophospholipase L1-like esterase
MTVAVCVLAAPTAATAAPRSVDLPQDAQYVAMGSSFAAGGGTTDPAEILDLGCGRLSTNYAHRVAEALDLELTDVTCGGATIDNLLDTPQVTFLDGRARAPQIEAVTEETDLVTITAGGNDVGYIANLWRYACQADPTPVRTMPVPPEFIPVVEQALCSGTVDRAAIEAALDALQGELVDLIEAAQERAPEARIVVVDYATLLPQSGAGCDVMPLPREQAKFILQVAAQMQRATKHATQRTGVELVELSKASRHHHACSDDPWVSGWEFGNILEGGTSAFHPTAEGMEAAAELVIAQLERG